MKPVMVSTKQMSDPVYQVPSLSFLALRVLERDTNSKEMKKIVSVSPTHFGHLLDKINMYHEMCSQIETFVFKRRIHGTIFGGYLRDRLGLVVPRDMDIRFEDRHNLEAFVAKLVKHFNILFVENKHNTYASIMMDLPFKVVTILVIHKDFPDIFLPLDLTVNNDWLGIQKDFDVNMLTMKSPENIEGPNLSKHDLQVLTRQIFAKVLFVVDAKGVANSDHHNDHSECKSRETWAGKKLLARMAKMEERGWTIQGKNECSNPTCVLASDEAFSSFCTKREVERQALLTLKRLERARIYAIRFLQRQMAEMHNDLPDFKECRRKESAKRNSAKIRKWKKIK